MTAVFLDLDGTLMESHTSILTSLQHAFRAIGRDDLVQSDLMWMIGPPFQDSFGKLGLSSAEIDSVLETYRFHYQGGEMFNASPYDGVMDALVQMRADGSRLYLMTAKPHVYATKITAHFGIADHMTREFGPETDGTHNWKGDLLAHALKVTGEDPARSVMVGDRHHDIAAAAEVGMPSLAAAWGYGSEEEWVGARAHLARPHDLPGAVRSLNLGST